LDSLLLRKDKPAPTFMALVEEASLCFNLCNKECRVVWLEAGKDMAFRLHQDSSKFSKIDLEELAWAQEHCNIMARHQIGALVLTRLHWGPSVATLQWGGMQFVGKSDCQIKGWPMLVSDQCWIAQMS